MPRPCARASRGCFTEIARTSSRTSTVRSSRRTRSRRGWITRASAPSTPGSRRPDGPSMSPSTTEKPSPRSTVCAATRASSRRSSPRMRSPTRRSSRPRCRGTRSCWSISRDGATRTCTPSRQNRESSFERPARNAPQRRSPREHCERPRRERGSHRCRSPVRARQGLRERLGLPERGSLSRLQPALDRRGHPEAQAERQPVRLSDLAAQSGGFQLPEDAPDDGERDRLGPESAEHGRQHAEILLCPRHHRPVRALEGLLLRYRRRAHSLRRGNKARANALDFRRQEMARGGLQPEGRVERGADSPAGSGTRGSSYPEASRDRRAYGPRELPVRGSRARSVHGERHRGGCRAQARAELRGLRDQPGGLAAGEAPRGPSMQVRHSSGRGRDSPRRSAMKAAVSRIQSAFERLARERRKALIPYVTAGDPGAEVTVPLMRALGAGGADVIELGVPFSDPMADGPVIQRSSERALRNRIGIDDVLAFVSEFRESDVSTPIVLMGYANPIEAMGSERFADAARRAGVDGVLVIDYPPEESVEFAKLLRARGIDMIFLLAPTSTGARIEQVARLASGYIYYVSLRGVTGAKHLDLDDVAAKLPEIRGKTRLPVGVGFGIRDGQTARAVAQIADAVVIGSRIIQEMEQASPETCVKKAATLLKEIRLAIDA